MTSLISIYQEHQSEYHSKWIYFRTASIFRRPTLKWNHLLSLSSHWLIPSCVKCHSSTLTFEWICFFCNKKHKQFPIRMNVGRFVWVNGSEKRKWNEVIERNRKEDDDGWNYTHRKWEKKETQGKSCLRA